MRIHVTSVDLEDLDDELHDEFENFQPIRRTSKPVSDRHANQYRSECGVNRHRKNPQTVRDY